MTESERDSKYIKELEETVERQNSIISELQEKLEPTSIMVGNDIKIDTSGPLVGNISFGQNAAVGYYAGSSCGFNYTAPAMATEKFVQDLVEEEKKKLMEQVKEMFKLRDDYDE